MTATYVRRAPRPVFCMIEGAHRDRGLADAVRAGRFTHAGVTVDLGTQPDWLTPEIPADEEWRIEWAKFYYGLDLAAAFADSGDVAYLRAWERLVLSWIDQVPVGFDSSDVAGRRIQNWIYAWSAFAAAPGFPGLAAGAGEAIFESLAAQVAHLRRHLTPERNHRTLELYALFVAAVALPELDDGLLDFAVSELHRNLLEDVRPDGVHREHSTHYHMVALRSYVGALENARRFGIPFPEGYAERLAAACEFAAHVRRPDGAIPALSDSDTGDYGDVLELAASLLGRPDLLYAATGGARGVAPSPTCVSFPDGGYYVQRSGWGEGADALRDQRYLVFDCGALGDGGHGHYDALSVEIAAGGRPLVVDPGRYTYSEEGPNWRRWFKGTAAHNTVTVDGLDQTPYRRGKPKGPVAAARLVERVTATDFDMLRGEVTSPSYEAVHERRVFFVAGEYWLLVDRVYGRHPRRFDLRFHLSPDAWGLAEVGRRERGAVVRAPGVALVVEGNHAVRIEDGWVAPRYGEKHRAPVVSVSAEGVYRASFVTLVVPERGVPTVPDLRVRARQAENGGVSLVEVRGAGPTAEATDLIAWADAPRRFELGGARFRATAAWARLSDAGAVLVGAGGIGEPR
jgi:hypothetical protein